MQFSEFHLPVAVMRAVQALGYKEPTIIQEKAIPLILAGKDVMGNSETGSGKTAAFGLPLISAISPGKGIHGLILTPTRELCVQVCDALRGFAKHLPIRVVPVFGGVGIGPQISALRTADIVVATPGRLLDIMERGLKLSSVSYVVLDEADRMLDMGFIDDVEKILHQTAKHRQTVLFSATLPPKLRTLVHKYMKDPVAVQAKTHVDTNLLAERVYVVSQQDKFGLLTHFLKHETPGIALVFCATRRSCDKVAKNLRLQHVDATPIHGGLSQNKRLQAINFLHKRGIGILVATDVASRGLHISNISHVYNYELPQTSDDYIHRIGRTARAGAKGDAVTLIAPQDTNRFRGMCREIGRQITSATLPEFEKVAMVSGPRPEGHHRGSGRPKQFWKRHR